MESIRQRGSWGEERSQLDRRRNKTDDADQPMQFFTHRKEEEIFFEYVNIFCPLCNAVVLGIFRIRKKLSIQKRTEKMNSLFHPEAESALNPVTIKIDYCVVQK